MFAGVTGAKFVLSDEQVKLNEGTGGPGVLEEVADRMIPTDHLVAMAAKLAVPEVAAAVVEARRVNWVGKAIDAP
jgi:hypothetical protein